MNTNDSNPVSEPQRGFLTRWLLYFFDGHYVDRSACDAAFVRMHQRDPIGDRLYLIFACLGLVCLFGPVTLTEIAFGPLVVFFFVRVINTFPVWIHGFGQPVALCAIVLSLWMMLSLRWSGDATLGWGEIAELRWFVLVGLIFPVIEKRKALIASMCVGIAIGQLAQVLDAFDGFGIDLLAKLVQNQPGRIAGWWHPVVGGSILVGALGLYLPAALFGSHRTRLVGVLGSITVVVGIIATGSRGAWIAGVLLIIFATIFGLLTGRTRLRGALIAGSMAVGVGLIAVIFMRGSLETRFEQTRTELAQIRDGQFGSDTGMRVLMAQYAIDASMEHPIVGVGAGGYQHWVNTIEPDSGVHAHAHNSFLQITSTLGIIGLVLWLVLILAAIRGAWRIWDPDSDGFWGLAPLFALVGLALASLTDSIQINTQTAAMLGALVALCPAYHPQHPRWSAQEPADK